MINSIRRARFNDTSWIAHVLQASVMKGTHLQPIADTGHSCSEAIITCLPCQPTVSRIDLLDDTKMFISVSRVGATDEGLNTYRDNHVASRSPMIATQLSYVG